MSHGRNGAACDINLWKGLAAGLVGGLVATIVMTKFQGLASQASKALDEPEGPDTRKRKKENGENATTKMASSVSENFFHHTLSARGKQTAGNAIHYGFGTTMGALYGMAAEVAPVSQAGLGTAFGTALFLGADEMAVPALGLSEPPRKTPVATHAYGLASHLVYGLTADLVRRGVRRLL